MNAEDAGALPAGCVEACRACPHRAWTAEASLRQKQEFLARTLAPWADALEPVRSVKGAARLGYRAKVKLVARWDAGWWHFGMESRDEFTAIPHCPVHAPHVNAVLAALSPALPPADVFPLRYVAFNGALLTLVVKCAAELSTAWLTPPLEATLLMLGLRALFVHRHPAAGRRLFAKKGWSTLFGEARVQEAGGLWHGPTAFRQLIPTLADEALAVADEFLQPNDRSAVADLYCGLGASARRWRERGASVLGVELDGEAVECAARNAPGAEILRGTCSTRLPQLRAWTEELPPETEPLAWVNPPRMGVEPDVLAWLATEWRPARLGLLSCSPGTLRRDLSTLSAAGYAVSRLVPFDFFPLTRHVETLALLARRV